MGEIGMNRATVFVIIVAVVAIGGFTYWSGTRPAGEAPAAAVDGATVTPESGEASASPAEPSTAQSN